MFDMSYYGFVKRNDVLCPMFIRFNSATDQMVINVFRLLISSIFISSSIFLLLILIAYLMHITGILS